jgi:hypothetical protein
MDNHTLTDAEIEAMKQEKQPYLYIFQLNERIKVLETKSEKVLL